MKNRLEKSSFPKKGLNAERFTVHYPVVLRLDIYSILLCETEPEQAMIGRNRRNVSNKGKGSLRLTRILLNSNHFFI